MVSSLTPLKKEGFYILVIHPYKEGAERINRAFLGVDDLTIERRPLSLKERVISLLTGLFLLIPLVNTIGWIAMQTFGEADPLTSPYPPSEEEPAHSKKIP